MPEARSIERRLRVAGLRIRDLYRVGRRRPGRFFQSGGEPGRSAKARTRGYAPAEDPALTLGLSFRAPGHMGSRAHIRAAAEGVEAMAREETACRPPPAPGATGRRS